MMLGVGARQIRVAYAAQTRLNAPSLGAGHPFHFSRPPGLFVFYTRVAFKLG